jgi:hypothetical protein
VPGSMGRIARRLPKKESRAVAALESNREASNRVDRSHSRIQTTGYGYQIIR